MSAEVSRRRLITRLTTGLMAAGALPAFAVGVSPQSPFLTQAEIPDHPAVLKAASPVESTATPVILQANVYAAKPYINPEATSCVGAIAINPDRIPTQNGFLEKNTLVTSTSPDGQVYYLERLNRSPGELEITEQFSPKRLKFSQTIIDAGLVPRVLNPTDSVAVHHQLADNYLLKLTAFLENNLALMGPTMRELGVVSEQNCLIDLMPHFRLVDVLHSYFFALDKTLRFAQNPTLNSTFSLAHYPSTQFQNDRFVAAGFVRTSVDVLKDFKRLEEGNQSYYHYTDAQLSAKKMHEFAHHLQFRGSMLKVLSDPDKAGIIATDTDELNKWIEREEEDKKKQFQDLLIGSGMKLKEAARFAPNEAQANLIAQLMIHLLATANGTDRFPGFGDDDPFNTSSTLFKIYRANLYHPMSLEWLNLHRDWPQIR